MRNGRTLKSVWALAAVAVLAVGVGACSEDTSKSIAPKAEWTADPGVVVPQDDGTFKIDFGTVRLGAKKDITVTVKNVGSAPMNLTYPLELAAPFSIADLDANTGAVLQVGETRTIALRFEPATEDVFEWQGEVPTDADEQKFVARLVGTGQAPKFACTPTTLDFGKVVRGRPKTLAVNCTNNTEVEGVLVVAPIGGDDRQLFSHTYTGDGGRKVVPAGATEEVKVTFDASGSGPAFATLDLSSELNGETEAVTQITLSATTLDHAISCEPRTLDFSFVRPGGSKELPVVCKNEGSDPFNLTEIGLDLSSEQRFTWAPGAPIEIPAAAGDLPGEVTISVTFSPLAEDSGRTINGILNINSDDPNTSLVQIGLTGFAGGPELSCSPASIDFGIVAKDLPATRTFVCTNVGTDDPTRLDDALVVTELVSTNPAEFVATVRGGLKAEGYQVSETFTVDVSYNPVDDGVDSASIQLPGNATNGTPEAPYAVMLTGTGRDLPPCDFRIIPASLRFAIVDKGDEKQLEFAVINNRTDAECLVQNVRMDPAGAPEFTLVGGDVALAVLPAGGELRFAVQFAPTNYAPEFISHVLFDISNPTNPHQSVEVRGTSQEPCALIAPDDLDFGTVAPGCRTREREFQIINVCSAPLKIMDVYVENQGANEEFFVRQEPMAGTVVAGGAAVLFKMAYRAADVGNDLGSVFIEVENSAPYMATLRGRGDVNATQTDSFMQNDRPKVDLLWVIDNSGSMSPYQNHVANNLKPFLSFAQAQEIDYQIGVTTTGVNSGGGCPGGADGNENGRLFPVDNSRPRIITPNTPNMEATWQANVVVGTCHFDEQPLEAAYRAITPPVIDNADDPRFPQPNDGNLGFLRKDAHLSIIALTDEYDQSPQTVNFYYNAYMAVKGFRNTHLFNFHAITGDKGTGCSGSGSSAQAGDRLIAVVEKTEGGVFQSLCSANWETSLREMSAAAFGFKTCFFIGNQPEDSDANGVITDSEITVLQNGRPTASTGAQGQRIWQYNPDQNAVCFFPLAVPEPGTQIDISYRVACITD